MLNKIQIIGRLGRDPELRYTGGGTAVTNFSVATTDTWYDKNKGERQERTEWHTVTVWAKQAETCAEHLSKGRLVYVEGRIQTREYTDRDGNQRKATEIVATHVKFLGGGEKREVRRQESGGGGWGGGSSNPPPLTDDSIPF